MADKDLMPEEAADTSTLQKKRARRRLVGAIALVLLAVIVLPMVMDRDPRPNTPDIQVRIPSQDALAPPTNKPTPAVQALPALPAQAADANSAQPAQAAAPVAATAAAVPPAPVAPAPVEAKPAQPAAPVATKPAAKPEAKPTAKPEVPATKKPEAKPEIKRDAPKPATKPEAKVKPDAKAKQDAKSDSKSELARAERAMSGGSAGGEQWVLQLGAYQEGGNVKALQAKIKELGYSSYTEKVETAAGTRIRVRAGPFASQAAAQAAQARLKKIGAGGPPGGVLSKK